MATPWDNLIESDPNIMLGKPVFKGTRITVEFILQRLGEGATEQDLLDHYVGLTPEHLRAAHAYAAALLRGDELVYAS